MASIGLLYTVGTLAISNPHTVTARANNPTHRINETTMEWRMFCIVELSQMIPDDSPNIVFDMQL